MPSPRKIPDLRFDIDVRLRYHERRRAFYERMHRFIAWFNVLAGSAAVAVFASELQEAEPALAIGLGAGLLLAVLNAYDLVIGTGERARQHESLYRRYSELDEAIERAHGDHSRLSDWSADALRIERDEPPQFKAVYVLCQNEAADVWGLPRHERLRVGFWRYLAAQWLRMPEHEFRSVRDGGGQIAGSAH